MHTKHNKNKIKAKALKHIFKANFGIEKENHRCDIKTNKIATTPHPKELGDKEKNPYITTDFSESQVEFVSPVFNTINKALKFISKLHIKTNKTLKTFGQTLHNYSMPPILPKKLSTIKTAKFSTNINANKYRKYLLKKYGLKNQLVCGIHYNFSFDDKLLKALFKIKKSNFKNDNITFKNFKNDIYLKVSKIISYERWLFVYLNGCGYKLDKSFYESKYNKVSKKIQPQKITLDKKTNTYNLKNGLSFRNGVFGYQNNPYLYASFKSFKSYIKSIKQLIANKTIIDLRELYHPVRLKTNKKSNIANSFKKGISYIELRFLDINSKYKSGVYIKQAKFIHLFLIYSLLNSNKHLNKKFKYNKIQQKEALFNCQNIAHNGKDINVKLTYNNKSINRNKYGFKILKNMKKVFIQNGIYTNKVKKNLAFIKSYFI
jgi:glutamate--cysteine ligase